MLPMPASLNGFYLLGWGADYPDATNFLDYHFGAGASKQFGDKFPDLVDAFQRAAALADPAERQPIYDEANELVKQHVPMIPVAHGGSATAFQAVCEGAHSSPLTREKLGVVDCGGDTLVFMQNAEPIASTAPTKPTATPSGPASRSTRRCCPTSRHHRRRASAGREVRRQRGPDRVDLHAAPGRHLLRR